MFLSALVSTLEPDGSLIVDLRSQQGPLLRFGTFADGMPRYRLADAGWVETAFDWDVRLVNPAHHARRDLPVLHYLSGWPQDLIEPLFPVWYAQSAVMQLCATHPAARDLLRTSPTLLWLLAACCAEEAGWREQAAELLALPQRGLLAKVLDLPDARPAQVRFLRKLVVMEGTAAVLSQIQRLAGDAAAVMALRHWRRLPTPLLPLATGPLLLHLHWLQEALAATGDRWMLGQILERHRSLVRDTSRMLEQLGYDGTDLALARLCRTPDGLAALHDALVLQVNHGPPDCRGGAINAALSFGPPPIASDPRFKAITNMGELYQEGRELRHCVASRAEDILAGACYIYRVNLDGERGTLQIGIRPEGLVIDEFRLRDNAEPSPAAWHAVADWIDQGNQQHRGRQ